MLFYFFLTKKLLKHLSPFIAKSNNTFWWNAHFLLPKTQEVKNAVGNGKLVKIKVWGKVYR
jgi:hypothetical protein